jgi:hypothetical protein|tara:strand:+ start:316 stop:552 length:237 start_codon:yes stop_codon:yes gene_type:complete
MASSQFEVRVTLGLVMADTIEEELALLARVVDEAERMGIDPWPKSKPQRPWAKYAIASFMVIMMLSWVSKILFRFINV